MLYGLSYTSFANVVEGYTDVNWISDLVNLKYTSRQVFLLGGRAIQWKLAK